MVIVSRLFAPLTLLWRALSYPLRLVARRNALKKHGWVELSLEGPVVEVRSPTSWAQQVLRRALRREEEPRVVLTRLRRLVRELSSDPSAKGVLVRLGPLDAGWASAAELGRLLEALRAANKEVVTHVVHHAGNKELLVAAASTRLFLPPAGAFAAVGAASHGLFLRDALALLGLKVEVAAMGKYKSAPDQFSRQERSEADRTQAQALVDTLDEALLEALGRGRGLQRAAAVSLFDEAPLVGAHAVLRGAVDALARSEDLPEALQHLTGAAEPPMMVGAANYLAARHVLPPLRRPRKKVAVVEVHGPITERAPPYGPVQSRAAVEQEVVAALWSALADRSVGAIVLHVNSRGGSAAASDTIWSAARRVDREKPVIACFGDVSASGGYYVGCGARAIYASPLTITGSIGVFAMLPTWPELAARLRVGHDVIKNRKNADLYDPWRGLDERQREKAGAEIAAMYEVFLGIVADARRVGRDAAHAVAQGRVWSGSAALEVGLVDGLGGMEEALERAREEAKGRFDLEPVVVRARGRQSAPPPPPASAMLLELLSAAEPLVREALALRLGSCRGVQPWAWAPLQLD